MAKKNPQPTPVGGRTFTVKTNPPVSCGEQDENGWIVIQRRSDGSENFNRKWTDYVTGFGQPKGECWLGLKNIRNLTATGNWTLLIEMGGWECNEVYASYTGFFLTSGTNGYQLGIDTGSYSGNAGDSLLAHNANRFSAPDVDNDLDPYNSCAAIFKGGWWFSSCMNANLNGQYLPSNKSVSGEGVLWVTWKGLYSLRFSEMKVKLIG